MFVRDLPQLKHRFLVRYLARHAELECRRCHAVWITTRANAREPRAFWLAGERVRKPAGMLELVRHAAAPH